MSLTLRQITEIAAFVSARSMVLIESSHSISDEHLQSYWKCCRGRTIDWLKTLDEFDCRLASASSAEHQSVWTDLEPVLNDIFVSELLTRVWGITLTAVDLRRGEKSAGPIARNTTSGHTEARNKALNLMVGSQVPMSQLARVDRVRRKAERWTDLLVGRLAVESQLPEFAFDDQRSLDFGQSQMNEFVRATDESVCEFVHAGIRLAFSGMNQQTSVSPSWNRGIVRSILGSFPIDCFDEVGMFKSLRRVRIERSSPESTLKNVAERSAADPTPRCQIKFTELKQRFGEDYRSNTAD
jgi:hypothetical protein